MKIKRGSSYESFAQALDLTLMSVFAYYEITPDNQRARDIFEERIKKAIENYLPETIKK